MRIRIAVESWILENDRAAVHAVRTIQQMKVLWCRGDGGGTGDFGVLTVTPYMLVLLPTLIFYILPTLIFYIADLDLLQCRS
jgi:hypothetical protein